LRLGGSNWEKGGTSVARTVHKARKWMWEWGVGGSQTGVGRRGSTSRANATKATARREAGGCAQMRPGSWSWELGVGSGRTRRGSANAEPVAVEHVVDGLGGEDGAEDFHATGAFWADCDVDGKHLGEEPGPSDAGGCRDRRRDASGKLELTTSLEQGQLNHGKLGPWMAVGDGGA
jgi:hypothetical protein